MNTLVRVVPACLLIAFAGIGRGDPPLYTVEVKDGASVVREILLPVDPTIRISPQHMNNIYFGLTVEGKRITCSPQGSIWPATLIDGQIQNPANGGAILPMKPLVKTPNGKMRSGFTGSWKTGSLDFTQTVEVIPSKPYKVTPGAKRRMDTVRISYLIENRDSRDHEVALRCNIDILVNNNDGALYASPTTEPGKILNGVVLQGKKLPPWLMVMERPNVTDPGTVGIMTFQLGSKSEGPDKVVLTTLGSVGGGWDVPAVQAGDSACSVVWSTKKIRPGEKRELAWAYGGGIAANPDGDGRVSIDLAGNLEPGKVFTVQALVEDPAPSQSLTIDFPAGIERIEGAETQPVPAADKNGHSLVLWKGRVTRPGNYEFRVDSSTGVTQTKTVRIEEIGSRP